MLEMRSYSITAGEVMSETTPLLGAAAALTSEIHIPQNDNKASVSEEIKVCASSLVSQASQRWQAGPAPC